VSDPILTTAEVSFCKAIQDKDRSLRVFLESAKLLETVDAKQWLRYLTGIKHVLGNLNNDLSFVATLLAKNYLMQRFSVCDFDAAGKPQGASGIDVEATTPDGKTVVGEIKTTTPYQPGFGAAQRTTILKDLARLALSKADYRFMFVVDPGAFQAICGKAFSTKAAGVELVDLASGQSRLLGSAL
jgi:hypothetical protein